MLRIVYVKMVSLVCEANMAIGLGTDYFCKNASEKPADFSNK